MSRHSRAALALLSRVPIVVRLNLFGAASIEAAGVLVTGRAAHGRRLALFALLACARGRSLTRDRVIGLLWPESSTERARRLLSDDVYIIRGALGDDVLRSIGDELSLDPDLVVSDVAMFERLLDAGDLEAAVALVAGPLLDGFFLSDAAEFEHWLDAERTRLGQLYASALQSLAEACETREQFADAAAWWRKLAAHDPYSGHVTLRLMRALEAAGDRAGALRHARAHAALLREEYDTEPDLEVTALAERLRAEPSGLRAAPVITAPSSRPATAPAATATDTTTAAAPPPATETSTTTATSTATSTATATAPETSTATSTATATAPETAPASAAAGPALPRAQPVDLEPSDTRRRAYQVAGIVLVFVVVAALVVTVRRATTEATVPARAASPSVGVLPFVNMSADPENTYFSDGLTEQVISALSRIDGLQVAARTSSFALRDGLLDVRAIGETLGVTAVLEGSVRADRSRLRITAQLIDAATGYHIWAEDFDRQIEDVFAVQEEIAAAIAAALELRLARPDPAVHASRVVDLEAYDLYLRGLYLRNSLTADALRQAIDYFDRAIGRQPDFALAYAAKASVIAPLVLFGHTPVEEGLREYRAITARALELDPASGEAFAALGIQKLFFDWEWDAAGQAFDRAIELNPSDAHAWHHLGNYMRAMGRLDEAIAARARGVELDPLNARTAILLAADYAVGGQHERAIAEYARVRRLDPVHPLTLGSGPWMPNTVANVYLNQGRERDAFDELVRVAMLRGAAAGDVDALRRGFDAGGMTGFWRSWLDMEMRQSSGDGLDTYRVAQLMALSGDTAGAFDMLDRAYAERNPALIMMNFAFRDLRTHPRIVRISKAMGLPAVE